MWIKEPGAVTERIGFTGRKELCSYLLKGDMYTHWSVGAWPMCSLP
jgi:hypothetical protein